MADDIKTSIGFYDTRTQGEAAVEALTAAGIPRDEISFLAGDTSGHETPAIGPVHEVGADTVAGRDATIGGIVGAVAGIIAMSIPGLGPLIAIGPLAGAIGGLGAGAAIGGLIGLLKDRGVSEAEAAFYAEGVKRGGALVMVTAPGEIADRAADIMKDNGAVDVDERSEQWRKEGWTGPELARRAG